MALYNYDDAFVVNSIDISELDRYENEAIIEVEKLNITDTHYKERLIIIRTYMLAIRSQYEADGMSDKYKVYEKEYDRAIHEALTSQKDGIHAEDTLYTVSIGRT